MPHTTWTLPPAGSWTRVTLLFGVAYFVVHLALADDPALRAAWAFLPFMVLAWATAGIFTLAARRSTRPGLRRALVWYAASFAATGLGSALYAGQQSVADVAPLASWSNLPYLASYLLAARAVLSLAGANLEDPARSRLWLDVAIAVVAGATLVWLLVLPDLGPGAGWWERLLAAAYPIGDLLIFAALVPLLLRLPSDLCGGAVRVLAFGQMAYLAGDVTYLFTHTPGVTPVFAVWDVLYLAGYGGMIWAAEHIWRHAGIIDPDSDVEPAPPARRNLLPMALGVVLYGFALREVWRDGPSDAAALTVSAAFVVTVLILMREWLTERRNMALARALEIDRGEARLRRLIRHLDIAIVVDDEDGRVRLANGRAETLLGAVDGERWRIGQLGRVLRKDGTDLPAGEEPATRARATGTPIRNMVIGITGPDRSEPQWLLTSAEPQQQADGRVGEVLSTFHDITDLATLESRLRQAQKMEVVGRLAGGIAHDFNNMLTSIVGYASVLRSGLPAGDVKAGLIDEVIKASDQAAALTQQLLAFSRQQILRPAVLDPNVVIGDTYRLLSRLLGEDVAIRLDLGTDLGSVTVDRAQMGQVLMNLALNARDAMPRGGVLTITTRVAPAATLGLDAAVLRPDTGFVVIEVTDTGTGMPPRTVARAFDPFFTTKPAGKGTGLGLSTVQGIVRQSHGDVLIKSQEGVGTTVSVYLPRAASRTASNADGSSGFTRGSRERILIVDDEPGICRVARRLLESNGYVVTEAYAPADAAARLAAADPAVDLLITDVVMPGRSGVDLAAQARERRPAMPVIFVTGYTDDVTAHYGLDLENSTLLAKPFSPAQLLGAVRLALDSAAASR